MGFNWIILTLITGSLSSLFSSNVYYSVFRSYFYDFRFIDRTRCTFTRFLGFDNEQVPVQNYIGWFVIGLVTQYLFQIFQG